MKILKRVVLHERFVQIILALGSIPSIVCWIGGHGSFWGVFVAGFNLGGALYWQFYIGMKRRGDAWRELATRAVIQKSHKIAKVGIVIEALHTPPLTNPEQN